MVLLVLAILLDLCHAMACLDQASLRVVKHLNFKAHPCLWVWANLMHLHEAVAVFDSFSKAR
jgi:hypothetical protein